MQFVRCLYESSQISDADRKPIFASCSWSSLCSSCVMCSGSTEWSSRCDKKWEKLGKFSYHNRFSTIRCRIYIWTIYIYISSSCLLMSEVFCEEHIRIIITQNIQPYFFRKKGEKEERNIWRIYQMNNTRRSGRMNWGTGRNEAKIKEVRWKKWKKGRKDGHREGEKFTEEKQLKKLNGVWTQRWQEKQMKNKPRSKIGKMEGYERGRKEGHGVERRKEKKTNSTKNKLLIGRR